MVGFLCVSGSIEIEVIHFIQKIEFMIIQPQIELQLDLQ